MVTAQLRTAAALLASLAGVFLSCLALGAEGEKALPRVLIMGDSIAGGYTGTASVALRGRAIVETHRGNGMGSGNALIMLDSWLGTQKWDLIHFNFGVWDLKINAAGRPVVPIDEYQRNPALLSTRLQRTGSKLIWASTVPIPCDMKRYGDVRTYNAVAARLMKFSDIPVQDIYAEVLPLQDSLRSPGDDVHFNERGRLFLGEIVAGAISEALGLGPVERTAVKLLDEQEQGDGDR